ncbi:hypothetical protein D3C71_1591880 [compost metagenome]
MQITGEIGQQGFRAAPFLTYRPGHAQRQRVTMATPKIRTGLATQRQLILHQSLLKQNAGLEGVMGQHTLTETVDGVYRRFVHLPLGRQQLRSGVGQIFNLRHQRGK